MKKLCVLAVLLAGCLALSGCIVINVPAKGVVTEAAGPQADPNLETQAAESAVDFAEPLEAGDELELDYEVPRTIVPATDADQVEGVKVDFALTDDGFWQQVDEVAEYSEDYIGKNLSMIGEVLHYDEPNPDTQFAIVRWYEDVHDDEAEAGLVDPETGEMIPHEHEPIPTGFDCTYTTAEVPAEKAWVKIVGTLEEYEYTDEESGEVFPALKLNVVHIEDVPDGQGGEKTMAWE